MASSGDMPLQLHGRVQNPDNTDSFGNEFVNDVMAVSGVVPGCGYQKPSWATRDGFPSGFSSSYLVGRVEQKIRVAVRLFLPPNIGCVGVNVGKVEVSGSAVLD
jgi:hypothetical protein